MKKNSNDRFVRPIKVVRAQPIHVKFDCHSHKKICASSASMTPASAHYMSLASQQSLRDSMRDDTKKHEFSARNVVALSHLLSSYNR